MKVTIPDHHVAIGYINTDITALQDERDRLLEECNRLDDIRLGAMNEELAALMDFNAVFQMPGRIAGRDVKQLFRLGREWRRGVRNSRDHKGHFLVGVKLSKITSSDRNGVAYLGVDKRFTHRQAWTNATRRFYAGSELDVIGKIIETDGSHSSMIYQVELDQ